jgi:hypothetical protein
MPRHYGRSNIFDRIGGGDKNLATAGGFNPAPMAAIPQDTFLRDQAMKVGQAAITSDYAKGLASDGIDKAKGIFDSTEAVSDMGDVGAEIAGQEPEVFADVDQFMPEQGGSFNPDAMAPAAQGPGQAGSAASGAATGMSVAGPWGALIGAAIGNEAGRQDGNIMDDPAEWAKNQITMKSFGKDMKGLWKGIFG